jgi:hypothetical protein
MAKRISDTLKAVEMLVKKREEADRKHKWECERAAIRFTDHDRIWHAAQSEAYLTAGLIVFESELNPKTMKPKRRKAY